MHIYSSTQVVSSVQGGASTCLSSSAAEAVTGPRWPEIATMENFKECLRTDSSRSFPENSSVELPPSAKLSLCTLCAQQLSVHSSVLSTPWTYRAMRSPAGSYGLCFVLWIEFWKYCITAANILFRWARHGKQGEAWPSWARIWMFINKPSAHCSGLWFSQSDSCEGGLSPRLTNDEALPEATMDEYLCD